MENKNQKKKNSGGLGFLVVIILMILSGLSEGVDSEIVGIFIFAVMAAGLFWLLFRGARALRNAAKKDSAAAPVHSMKRNEPKVEIHRAFPEPEAHCVVCENTGVDHFTRDRQLRLSQLDEWLKNGLIDRAEYAVLKRKFEQS